VYDGAACMNRRDLLRAAGAGGVVGLLGAVYASSRVGRDDRRRRPIGADFDAVGPPAPLPARETSAEPTGRSRRPPDSGTTPATAQPPTASPTDDPPQTTATPPTTEPPPDDEAPHAAEFDRVVDAVAAGADPTGGEAVNFLFDEQAVDDTLLAFEPGEYLIDYFSVYDVANFGVVSTGPEPVTFVPADGDCRGGHPWAAFDSVSDLLLENVLFDFRDSSSGGPVHLLLHGDSTVRDVTYVGSCSNQISAFKMQVRDPQGTALFERVDARNVDDNQSLTGTFVTSDHAGAVTFRDCILKTFSDNGLYASAPGLPDGRDGRVDVVNCTYRNNNVANVRLGSTDSRASGVTVEVDSSVPGWGRLNARGIRLRNRSGQVVENCAVTFGTEAADSFGGVVFHPDNGGAVVRDTQITVDRDGVPAVRAFPVSDDGADAPVFENLAIDGAATGGIAARIEGRDGTVFEGCTVAGDGADRGGLRFVDSVDCRLVDTEIDVTGPPVVARNATVEMENCLVVTAAGERRIDRRVLEDETLAIE
jgi:hypothetical protein